MGGNAISPLRKALELCRVPDPTDPLGPDGYTRGHGELSLERNERSDRPSAYARGDWMCGKILEPNWLWKHRGTEAPNPKNR